jgi:hypothetical protein
MPLLGENLTMNRSGSGAGPTLSLAPVLDRLTAVHRRNGEPSAKSIHTGQLTSMRGAGVRWSMAMA